MTIQTFSAKPVAPRVVRAVAIIALAAGLGIWAALLFAPAPKTLAPALPENSANPGIQPIAQWFGGRTLGIKIDLVGVIANTGGQGSALLSINNQPARTYRNGQSLAPGIFLETVSHSGITISQDGVAEDIPITRQQANYPNGFSTQNAN
ncbi:MAG: hypothetical protein H5U29_05345 [Pusillimonas sp.]|nr:hypothetical protein [Pusillimonas sp.]